MNDRTCLYCQKKIKLNGKTWVHEEHGMIFVMYCSECDWTGEQPAKDMNYKNDICPKCKEPGVLRDHHLATPLYDKNDVVEGGETK